MERPKIVTFPPQNSCSHNPGWHFSIFSNKLAVFLAAVQTAMAVPLQWLVAPVNAMTSCVWNWKLDGTYKRAPVYRSRISLVQFIYLFIYFSSQENTYAHVV